MNPSEKRPIESEKSSSESNLRRKPLKLVVKIIGSLVAVWLLFTQVDMKDAMDQMSAVRPVYLLVALFLFNASQWLSALRLNSFFRDINIHLSESFNLRLYYIGMFYNLLVPGGVGGDGLKGFLIFQNRTTTVKQLTLAMVADRLTGLIAIFIWATLLTFGIGLDNFGLPWLSLAATLISIVAFYGFFIIFRPAITRKVMLALLVQGAQMAVVFTLLMGMGITENYLAYLLVFLTSSVATIIPITIGGLGLRELVFLYGARYLGLDADISVAVSLLFFLITLVSSLPGIYLHASMKSEHWAS